MLNRVIVMGRLTKDPELRRTQSGHAVASFSIACDRDYSGDGGKETDFLDIVAWRSTAEFVRKYFTKGRMAVISGRLQIRSWTDKDGNGRRSAEIVADSIYFGDSKPGGQSGSADPAQLTEYSAQSTAYPAQSGGTGYSAMPTGVTVEPPMYPEIENDDALPF